MLILTKEQVEVIERVEDEIDYVNTRISNIRIGMRVCEDVFSEETKEKKRIDDLISKLESIEKSLEELSCLTCYKILSADDQGFRLDMNYKNGEDEKNNLPYIIAKLQSTICDISFSMGQLNESLDVAAAMLLNLYGAAKDLNTAIQSLIKVLYEIEIK